MNIGSTSGDTGTIFVGLLLLLFVPIIVICIGRLVGIVIGVRSGVFPFMFLLVVGVAVLVGGSLYLDTAGTLIRGLVLAKQENVHLRQQGDWSHDLSADVRYRLDGSLPGTGYLGAEDSSVRLKLWAPAFDTLRVGDTPQFKILPLWRSITLVRLANSSTRDWIPWHWLGIGMGGVALGWLVFKAFRSRTRVVVVAAVLFAAVALVVLPALVMYQQWRVMEDLAAKPLRATATIENVTRITRIDPLPCKGSCDSSQNTAFDVPQQYDIVQMRFTPSGARDSVLAVDAADVDAAQLLSGSRVHVAYAANDPRAVQIVGATHSHHWKNMIMFAGLELFGLVVLGIVSASFSWGTGRVKRVLAQTRSGIS